MRWSGGALRGSLLPLSPEGLDRASPPFSMRPQEALTKGVQEK